MALFFPSKLIVIPNNTTQQLAYLSFSVVNTPWIPTSQYVNIMILFECPLSTVPCIFSPPPTNPPHPPNPPLGVIQNGKLTCGWQRESMAERVLRLRQLPYMKEHEGLGVISVAKQALEKKKRKEEA